ncbi:hypothetical protein TESG_00379 [Trichophyton tonsurans CBS 112818]|uniref:Uncharacterized protein n=2 Tax=Trichophyton TaxID=5550 RepID=F2PU55_TRIEC|nr:hypothetical protein TESG_00379 [Trichophyton tonsurans CBS 112818]EGE05423.1 hypothetical protein TEQG_04299 [Trichophyton equinum CBS 127.97]
MDPNGGCNSPLLGSKIIIYPQQYQKPCATAPQKMESGRRSPTGSLLVHCWKCVEETAEEKEEEEEEEKGEDDEAGRERRKGARRGKQWVCERRAVIGWLLDWVCLLGPDRASNKRQQRDDDEDNDDDDDDDDEGRREEISERVTNTETGQQQTLRSTHAALPWALTQPSHTSAAADTHHRQPREPKVAHSHSILNTLSFHDSLHIQQNLPLSRFVRPCQTKIISKAKNNLPYGDLAQAPTANNIQAK